MVARFFLGRKPDLKASATRENILDGFGKGRFLGTATDEALTVRFYESWFFGILRDESKLDPKGSYRRTKEETDNQVNKRLH
jgi:hypothetical protein